MWNRREWAQVIAAGWLGSALGPVWSQVKPTAPSTPVRAPFARVQIAVDNRSDFNYLPLTIAERLGYFAAEGLDVQVRELPEPGQALQALQSAAVQALSGPYSASVMLRSRSQSFPSIVLQGRAPQLVLGVPRNSKATLRDLRGLQGRKIAVTGLGSASQRLVLSLLSMSRMAPGSVQFVPLSSPSAAIASFRSGMVDAICHGDLVMTQLEQDGGLKVVADTRTVRGTAEVYGGPMPTGCLMVSGDYLTNHAPECQAMVSAMVRALKWLQTAGFSDINKTVPESYFLGDPALYLAAFNRTREAWSPDGVMPESGPMTAARVMMQLDDLSPSLRTELSKTFTNVLAMQAKTRFRA